MGKITSAPATTLRLASLLALGCLLAARPAAASGGESPRLTLPLEEAWSFHYGGEEAASALAGQVAGWPVVRVPHTWNAADGADGGGDYARGAGWYVRRFRLEPAWAGRRVFVQFDGASRVATVFLNGRKIGEHTGGFARFRFDLSDALQSAGENILAVRVSNAEDGTAPVTADFTFFGGLYRGVTLLALDPLHIDVMDHAADGVYVTPQQVSAARADFTVAVQVRNDSDRAERAVIRTVVREAQGAAVATREETREIAAHVAARMELAFSLENPHRWNGRPDPYQYTAAVAVRVDGNLRDEVQQHFGLRSVSLDPDRGFFLNGAPLDLHGVSRHQDRAGKGWAISAEDDREDFALIEELGATALRVAHYPQSSLWFDLADERGLVVWAEIPVVNEVLATDRFTENARQQLRELIRQNYNRPAICCWGVGNETREAGETSGRARVDGLASNRLIADLAQLARAEDPTRPSTYASHHQAGDARNFHTDVLGFNKYFGWYGGAAEDFAAWADDVHRRYPALRFSVSEYGAGANTRQHEVSAAKPVPGGPWHPEEYQTHFHEVWWQAMRTRPYLWGKFIWNMFDFAADIRAEGAAAGLNDKGLVTYDRKTRKDAFFWYQANWSSAPVLHLTGRRFTERPAGKTEIKAYANVPRVELLLNGVSCGSVTSDTHIFRWSVELAAGANRVMVRAPVGAATLEDECVFTGLRAAEPAMQEVVRDSLEFSAAQYTHLLAQLEGKTGYPRSVAKGEITLVRPTDWTSGFFPGSLWYLFEATGDPKWRAAAATATAGLKAMQDHRGTHDLGFILYCSYGNGLRLTGEAAYRDVLLAGAESLGTRFNPTVGCIKSWDGRKQWLFPVIIDNLMNLELLTWAAQAAATPRFLAMALSHADTTMRNHFRADGGSFHVVDYDPATGTVRSRVTHQGAADDSAWARGQAWGLYGYTAMYRATHKPGYLAQARKIAGFLLNHPRLPADKIPYWDFDAPAISDAPRDASAAAIMCSALFELSDYVDAETGRRYAAVAEQQLRSLASPAYRAKPGENHGFLLMHSTGNFPKNDEIDVPINYADYYFLEALLRCKARLATIEPRS